MQGSFLFGKGKDSLGQKSEKSVQNQGKQRQKNAADDGGGDFSQEQEEQFFEQNTEEKGGETEKEGQKNGFCQLDFAARPLFDE